MLTESIEIFPWNDNFSVGIPEIDEQHEKLVQLINSLSTSLVFKSDTLDPNKVFSELSAYAVYHFKTEENIWNNLLTGDEWEAEHKKSHSEFISGVQGLKNEGESKSNDQVLENLLSFLTHWLALHILESDMRMAKTALAVKSGMPLSQAKIKIQHEMSGATGVLVKSVLSMYDAVATRTLQLMREIEERRKIEQKANALIKRNYILMKSTPEGVHILDELGNVIEANDSFCQHLGYTMAEVLKLSVYDFEASLPPEEIKSAIKKVISGHAKLETVHRRKDGTLVEVEIISSGVELDGKKCIFALSRDITERKKEHEALIESLKFESDLINSMLDGFSVLNKNGVHIDVNPALCKMTGFSREELIGVKEPFPYWPQEEYENIRAAFQKTLTGITRNFELIFMRKDGERFPVIVSPFTVKNRYGNVVSYSATVKDITEIKQAEALIIASEKRFRRFFEKNSSTMLLIEPQTGKIIDANETAANYYGYSKTDLIGMFIGNINTLSPDRIAAEMKMAVEEKRNYFNFSHRISSGDVRDVEVYSTPIVSGGQKQLFTIIHDITDRKRAEESMRVTASVFDISQEGIVITDSSNNIIDVNPAFTRITGYDRNESIGKDPKILSSGRQGKTFYEAMWKSLNTQKSWRGEVWNRRKSGEIYPEMLSISVLYDSEGKVLRHVAVFSDISVLKEHETELRRVAHYDPLTSIPNRLLLADRMKQAISQTSRDQCMMAVCYLDLDGFKPINDALGHQAGDEVLMEVAKRIGITIRGGDTVARLGGDEFVILLLGLEKGEECIATLERILATIAEPFTIQDRTVLVSASIGVSIYPLDEEDPDLLLRHADQAMYVAKQSGKNRFHIYDVELDKLTKNQSEFIRSIKLALELNQFELHYQPLINLRTKKLIGAEALIRWQHPQRGLLLPAEFLRQVENTDLDIKIGEWVISTALAQFKYWQSIGLNIEIGINISGFHLESVGFVDNLRAQLAKYSELPRNKLIIEVLETVALSDVNTVQGVIESCRKIGVGFALDDFGTGYSSLSYLSGLSVDLLKIDQSFVRDMLTDKKDLTIVQGIIALAKAFELHTVAEGIETDEMYQALLEMECEFGQGYGIARPMPASELIKWKLKQT